MLARMGAGGRGGGGREVVEGGLVGYPVGGSGWTANGD